MKVCKSCNIQISNSKNIFCNNKCQAEFQYFDYINKWKNNTVCGLVGSKIQTFSRHIKRYIREKFKNKCSKCNWRGINIKSKKSTLEINHIDGNYKNNQELNLELLCPNCHSLTENYKNLNRGKGRKFRN